MSVDWLTSALTSVMLQGYGLVENPNEHNVFNLNNAIYQLPKSSFEIQIRPDFLWEGDNVEVWLKPRAYATRRSASDHFSGELNNGQATYDVRMRLNEGGVSYFLNSQWSVDVSREAWLWGASLFTNITNPFYPNNGRNNPYRELGGTDNIKVSYLSESGWTFTAFNNFARGNRQVFEQDFEATWAMYADYKGDTYAMGGLLSKRQGDEPALGVFGQWTVNDALLLYAEANARASSGALYPQSAFNPVGQQLAEYPDEEWRGDIVIGGNYSFSHGGVLGLEFARLGWGYNDTQAAQYFALGERLPQLLQSPEADPALFSLLTNQAANTGLNFLRQRYAFASYMYNGVNDTTDINLRFAYNVDDDSKQVVLIVDHFISDSLKGFFLWNQFLGDEKSELNQVYDSQAYLGVEWYF